MTSFESSVLPSNGMFADPFVLSTVRLLAYTSAQLTKTVRKHRRRSERKNNNKKSKNKKKTCSTSWRQIECRRLLRRRSTYRFQAIRCRICSTAAYAGVQNLATREEYTFCLTVRRCVVPLAARKKDVANTAWQ